MLSISYVIDHVHISDIALVAICTDCTSSCTSNYHTITTQITPSTMQTQLVIHVVALDILCYITYERDPCDSCIDRFRFTIRFKLKRIRSYFYKEKKKNFN
jgi:hypothetical protein